MTVGQILLAIITGLALNECCDVSPWVARELVHWSAHHRYVPPSRGEVREATREVGVGSRSSSSGASRSWPLIPQQHGRRTYS